MYKRRLLPCIPRDKSRQRNRTWSTWLSMMDTLLSNLYPWGYVPCPAYPPSFDDIYTRRTLRCFAGSHLRCRVVALPALVDAAYTPCPTFRDHPYDLCCILDKPSLISDDSVALSEPGHSSSGKPKRKISAAICTDNGTSRYLQAR